MDSRALVWILTGMSSACLCGGSVEEIAEELNAWVARRKGPTKDEVYLHCTLSSSVGEIRRLSIRSQGFKRDKTAKLLNNGHKLIVEYIDADDFSQVSCLSILRRFNRHVRPGVQVCHRQ